MPIDLDRRLIAPDDPHFQGLLQNLQGNILKGHGRDHTVHVFLSFRGTTENIRAGLGDFARNRVTSAAVQRDETDQFKKYDIPGGLFCNAFLTRSGYEKLGIDDGTVAQFDDPFFQEGMRATIAEVDDPPPSDWESGYHGSAIDAMLLLADDDLQFLLREARKIINGLSTFADILQIERGKALRNADREGIEHFGYVDGRSQPIYFSTDMAAEGPIANWDPSEPLKRVLIEDFAAMDGDSFGSYFVFRKLEQNVRDFKVAEQQLADALHLTGADRERAGAMAVGRFEDGTPLVLSQTDGFQPAKANDFQYDLDEDGAKCPFQAHIRKTNPRGDVRRKLVPNGDDEILERSRRITRRGITYGERPKAPGQEQALTELPSGEVGLLFMCFQSSIERQFVFMQKDWANSARFILAGTGGDPLIGQPPAHSQSWCPRYGDLAGAVPFSFGGFVKMKGGEYFFAPSMSFLIGL